MKPSVSQHVPDNSVSHKHAAFMDFSVKSGPALLSKSWMETAQLEASKWDLLTKYDVSGGCT